MRNLRENLGWFIFSFFVFVDELITDTKDKYFTKKIGPWKEVKGIVVDVVFHKANPRHSHLTPFSLVRFLDLDEYGEHIITVEIPQLGLRVAFQADRTDTIGLKYRWRMNGYLQKVLDYEVSNLTLADDPVLRDKLLAGVTHLE